MTYTPQAGDVWEAPVTKTRAVIQYDPSGYWWYSQHRGPDYSETLTVTPMRFGTADEAVECLALAGWTLVSRKEVQDGN